MSHSENGQAPEPMTPPESDLRGMPYMPLDVVRLFDSDFYALSSGDEFKAGLTLWGKAFMQTPAGSLPNDDRLLAHLSGAGMPLWKRVKAMALRGWVLCSDGRLYHRTVAEKVQEAWRCRLERRARTEAARAARLASRAASNTEPPPSVTEPVTTSVTDNVTRIATRVVTASKGTEQKKEESKKGSGASAPDAGASDARSQLWTEGVPILRGLTGLTDPRARSLLGRLLADARDDCAVVFNALWEANDARPLDPTAWLRAAVRPKHRQSLANSGWLDPSLDDPQLPEFAALSGPSHVH